SDNGSPMKEASFLETIYTLGITPSRSRPRVSNDNAFVESAFKTYKYRPGYPASGFKDIDHARVWALNFVRWYNNDHHHSGLNY
ncbi:MAG: transposase, partial [Firmicutes bacterium]|nr:transposase [Bacillota bacterium]